MPPERDRAAKPQNRRGAGGNATSFKPGQSGNPGGRPKIIAEVRDLAREQTEAAIKALVEIVKGGESAAARVSAAQALLDRGWGKPMQMTVTATTRSLADMTDEEISAELARLSGETD